MKTIKFRLLAMIITLAAVTATTTLNAQRRSTSNNNNSRKVENSRTDNKGNIEKKSISHNNSNESRATSKSVKSNSVAKRNSASAKNETRNKNSRKDDFSKGIKKPSERQVYTNNSIRNQNRENKRATNQSDKNRERVTASTENSKRSKEGDRIGSKQNYDRNRNASRSNSERYNLDKNDSRYRPTRDYKGSSKYWSSDFRRDDRNHNYSSGKNGYKQYQHWDHGWEGYRWNHNSWVNYYSFYDPYSYRNHKYYYHHNYYGHVIRKFVNRPQIYVHNHIKYYCYDGYFFRYRSGIGYVLVDMPFGMSFDYLPKSYDRVYVNGYLYFRVGNLFFERTNYGFQLVHYPERYFAFNDGYSNGGFRFIEMNY